MVMAFRLRHLLNSSHRTAVQIHQVALRRRMRKDHAATAPVAGWMWPGAWHCIAHAALLRQRQGNAALLQVGCARAARQGGLERGELLGEVGPGWGGRTQRRWAGCWLARRGRHGWAVARPPLVAGRRPWEGGLAL